VTQHKTSDYLIMLSGILEHLLELSIFCTRICQPWLVCMEYRGASFEHKLWYSDR